MAKVSSAGFFKDFFRFSSTLCCKTKGLKRSIRFVISIGLIVCIWQESDAQNDKIEKSKSDLPHAQTIADRHIAARGGAKKLAKAKSLTTKAKFKHLVQSKEGVSEYYQVKGKFYLKTDIKDYGVIEQGFDGKVAWTKTPSSGLRLATKEELVTKKLATRTLFSALNWSMGFPGTFKTIRMEKVGDRPAVYVEFSPTGGNKYGRYFDKETMLIVKTMSIQGPTKMVVERTYEDFREVDGIKFAFKASTFAHGKQYYEKTYDSIELDKEIDPKLFTLPEDVVELLRKREAAVK